MKILYSWSVGNYGECHDNLFKAIVAFLKYKFKKDKKIRFKIYVIK